MGGKKKQRTKWRTLPMANPEADTESYFVEQPRPARPPQSSHRQPPTAQQRRAPRLVSSGLLAVPVAAIPLVPSCPPHAGSGVRFENGPDPEAKGCYVNGLWIPASELPRTQWLQLFLLLPRPCWAPPGTATGAQPPPAATPLCADVTDADAATAPLFDNGAAVSASDCQAYRDQLGLAPTPNLDVASTTSCRLASEERVRTEPSSSGSPNGSCEDRLQPMESGTAETRNDDDDASNAATSGGLEDLVNRTLARCLEEARPEIILQHRHRSHRWAATMAQQLLEQALVDARAEVKAKKHNHSATSGHPSWGPSSLVDGEASRLASEILSAAVSATAQTLREVSQREERAGSNKRPSTGSRPQPPPEAQQQHQPSPSAARRLLTTARDKAHFLADPATSPESALREVLGAGQQFSSKKPSEPRCAEIVVHEMDEELSETGSEDVELLGHRYETAAPKTSVRGESLATELRRCREPSPGDSGVQSQESGDEASVSAIAAS